MQFNNLKLNRGFSLIEVLFAVSIFAIVVVSVFQGFTAVTGLVSASRDKIAAVDVLNSEMELVRNLSFANVGLQAGVPSGVLLATTTVSKDGRIFSVVRSIRNIDDPFDGTIGGTPNDLSPADYKLVQINITCDNCKKELSASTQAHVSPKNLETALPNGALFIRVFDANGGGVPQANVQVLNSTLGININETTDNNGLFQIVDTAPAQNSYRIIVTKDGYTTDRTYATSSGNPNPLKLDATVLLQQLTQISFVIDKTSDINFRTVTNTCSVVPSVPFVVNGTKLIGTSPDVPKWTGNFTTNGSGVYNASDIEWDLYSFETTGAFHIAGTNPISPVSMLPDSSQNIDLIISSDPSPILLVNVKDGATNLPISGANVRLYSGGFNETLVTDQGFLKQTDWSEGSGQLDFSDPARFHSQDGNIDIDSPDGELKLVTSLGSYVPYGELTSSIFDTGTSSNWSRVDILPSDQPTQAGPDPVKFQIATSPDNTATTTWNFVGPDATAGTYYTISDNNINAIHDGHRYVRYKIFLSTVDSSFTPNVSDFALSFSSSCIPPGQVSFSDLPNGSYTLEVGAPGFATSNIPVNISSPWQMQDVLLMP